jgi:hypothetical protein
MEAVQPTLTFNTAGLLFPAISLLMLAYTNRFLGLTSAARNLAARYRQVPDALVLRQVRSLRQRLWLVRHTQAMGVLSLLSCTICFAALFFGRQELSELAFGASLVFMLTSLAASLAEIHLSIRAIQIELDGLAGCAS